MYGKSSVLKMGWYLSFRKNNTVFSFVIIFLSIAFVMFLFFCVQIMRPVSMLNDRMNNTSVNWEEIKQRVTGVNFGENPEQVIAKMGEPDEVYTSGNIVIYSYQKYGMYKEAFKYDVEFREDTLYRITTPDDFK